MKGGSQFPLLRLTDREILTQAQKRELDLQPLPRFYQKKKEGFY